jgi:hypothetical protein
MEEREMIEEMKTTRHEIVSHDVVFPVATCSCGARYSTAFFFKNRRLTTAMWEHIRYHSEKS